MSSIRSDLDMSLKQRTLSSPRVKCAVVMYPRREASASLFGHEMRKAAV